MEIWNNVVLGFSVALTPFNLLLAFVGVFLGTVIGVLPGIGPMTGIALLILLMKGDKDKFYPAMPFLSVGCLIGYGIFLLL